MLALAPRRSQGAQIANFAAPQVKRPKDDVAARRQKCAEDCARLPIMKFCQNQQLGRR